MVELHRIAIQNTESVFQVEFDSPNGEILIQDISVFRRKVIQNIAPAQDDILCTIQLSDAVTGSSSLRMDTERFMAG